MTRSPKTREADPASLPFEAAIAELEQIIDRIEQGKFGLEESLAQRRRGDALIKRCRTILDAAAQELKSVKGPRADEDDDDNGDQAD